MTADGLSGEPPAAPSPAHAAAPLNIREASALEAAAPFLRGEEALIAIESDMALPNRFQVTHFVVTSERLLVIEDGAGAPRLELPLTAIISCRLRTGLGSGILIASTPDGVIELLRFSSGVAPLVEQALPELQKLLPEPPEEADGAAGVEPSRKTRPCPGCGRPMLLWMSVCPRCVDRRQLLIRLIQRTRGYFRTILLTFLLTAFLRFCAIYPAKLQQELVDDALNLRVGAATGAQIQLHLSMLWQIIALMAIIRIAASVVGATQQYLMTWLGERVTNDLRMDVYTHLQRLGVNYYDQKETGWIMDRVTGDTSTLQTFLTDTLQRTLVNIITLIVIALFMFFTHPLLAVMALFPAPLVWVMRGSFMRRTHKIWHWAWRRRSRMFAILSNVLPGVRVVKAFVQEGKEHERFRRQSEEYMNARIDAARAFATFSRATNFVMSLSTLVIWGYGGYLVLQNPTGQPSDGVTIGILVMFMSLVAQFYSPLQELTSMSQQIQQATTSAQRVFEVLDTTPDMEDAPDAIALEKLEGSVEFRRVTFAYDMRRPVLKDVSFQVRPGEMIGLVGPSGAGKSTMVSLICRFYDASAGEVLIDGHDVRRVKLASIRSSIGVVLQEPFLFHGSIADNIAYGVPGAAMPEIIRAARAANAHDFIMRLPDGYDSLVGERGTRLSGGERQRISIARAILKNPRILILDEATSSVDTETEALIRQAIDRLVQGRTTFAIAHRLSTLQHADRLLVMERGELVESGTHEELLAREDGVYRRLVDVQKQLSEAVVVAG